MANLHDHPKQRSQSGNTSSRRITEDSTEPECEANQNSQWEATTTTKRRHGSSETTRDDYPRKQAFSAPATSGKSTSSTMRSASSTIGTGHHEHHPRSSYSRTPHSIRPEDERSIPDTISTGNLDKSDSSQPRQDNISWNTGDSPMDTSPNKMLPLPAIRTCRQGMHNQTAKVWDLQCQPRNQGMSTEERKGRNSGTSMCQLPRKTRRSLSEMPSSSTSSSSNEAKDNHSAQKRGTPTAPEEKINHHSSRPGNQATSTTARAAHPSTTAESFNQSEAATTSQENPRDSPANQNHLRGTPTNQRETSTSPTYETSTRQEQSTKGTGVSNTSHQQPRHRNLQKGPSSMQIPGADIQRASSEQSSQNSSRFSQRHHPDHRGGTQPTTVRDIKLLHFNCQGANNKKPAIEHAVRDENFDIICLQDTRLEPIKENPSRSKFNLADFDIYHRPKSENCHGIWTAIHRDFPSENISANFDFGTKTEHISVRVHLKSSTIVVHNIYSLDGKPDIRKAIADTEPSIFCGDFNAHHRVWGPTQDRLGESLLEQVESSTRHAILNTGEPTNISGTGIDITIASNNIAAKSEWSVLPY